VIADVDVMTGFPGSLSLASSPPKRGAIIYDVIANVYGICTFAYAVSDF